MNRIVLTRTLQGWVAEYFGPQATEIQELFGCTVLPTAFTVHALPEVVKRSIQNLNPGVSVECAQ